MKKEIFGILALAAIFAFAMISFLSVPANASAQKLINDVTSYSSNDVASTSGCPLASGSESTCPMANGDLDECPVLHGGNCPLASGSESTCPLADNSFGEGCPMRNNQVAGGCQG